MKKILTLAVAFLAIASQAASINWNLNLGSASIKDSSATKMEGTAYLLLSSDIAVVEAAKSADAATFIAGLNANAIGQTAIVGGKPSPSTSGTFSSNKLTAGTMYSYAFLIFDSAKSEYYVSATVSEAAYDPTSDDAALSTPMSISFGATDTFATRGTAASSAIFLSAIKEGGDEPGPGGDDPTPGVPEPATGALALAGLALLFRRKRA